VGHLLVDYLMSAAYFRFIDSSKSSPFVIELVDRAAIDVARRILTGTEQHRTHVIGHIIKERAWYNPHWDYHLDPASIQFFETSVEVCDATMAYVQQHLSEVGGATLPGGEWCPWTSQLIDEVCPAKDAEGTTPAGAV
jgi:hypothetical protein